MASQTIPKVHYLRTRLRLCQGALRLLRTELLLLEGELVTGVITQDIYDDTVAAINHDLEHQLMLRQALTEIKYSEQSGEAA